MNIAYLLGHVKHEKDNSTVKEWCLDEANSNLALVQVSK